MYGPFPQQTVPNQDQAKILLLADRWYRAAQAHSKWAATAKECVDFMEGRHWTEDQIAAFAKQNRPALRFNKIAPLVRLILGYQRNNRQDIKCLPATDSPGADQVADALSRIIKQISEQSQMPYVDAEVFMDGIIGGRGFFDNRLDFENNDLGEIKVRAKDPFSIYLDPDGNQYDMNQCGYFIESRFACIDEIRAIYGEQVSALVEPFTRGETPMGPLTTMRDAEEITPVRMFGQREDAWEWWDNTYALLGDFTDPLRRSIRLMDFQYWVREKKRVFIDLETGDKEVIPDHWGSREIEKALWYAEQQSNPIVVDVRNVKRVRWTTMIGDTLVYDKWSMYDGFSLVGYFPYFRRGFTQGMVSDLIDPQKEVNKRRSAEIDIVMRSAHSGWMFHEHSLDPKEELNLKRYGARPGVNVKWKGTVKPEKIQPSTPPTAMERLEDRGRNDLREISGINEAALGQVDQVQSGRALEAKQRQAVIAVQMYTDNFSQTKRLQGAKFVNLIQKHYTENRLFRILGEDGKFMSLAINQDQGNGLRARLNDVTVGKYTVSVNETPLSASFLNAQFEEALLILEKLGPVAEAMMQVRPDLIVEMSSLPRKEEWTQALQQAMGMMQAQQAAAAGVPPPGAGMPPGGAPVSSGAPASAGVSLDQASGPAGLTVVAPDGRQVAAG